MEVSSIGQEKDRKEMVFGKLMGRNRLSLCQLGLSIYPTHSTSLLERKGASEAAEKLLIHSGRTKSHVIKVIEGFETVMFKSKFSEWPPTPDLKLSSEDGRGKVAALLKSQGLDVKGLMKAAPEKEEPQAYIDCTGHLHVPKFLGFHSLVSGSIKSGLGNALAK